MMQLRERDIAEQISLIAGLTEESVAEQSRHATENFLEYGPIILADSIRALDRDAPVLIVQLNNAARTAGLEQSRIVLLKTCSVLAGAQYGLAADLREKHKPALLATILNAGLHDPSPEVRKTVVKILRNNFSGADMYEPTAAPLAMMIADTDPDVSRAAAQNLAGRMEWHMLRTRENSWERNLRGVFMQRAEIQHIASEKTAAMASEISRYMSNIENGLTPGASPAPPPP